MPGLITFRPGPLPWQVDAMPYTYSEAAKDQFKAMPGIAWVPDPSCPNRRGCWRGDREAIRLVCATLEAAKISAPRWPLPEPAGRPHISELPPADAPPELRQYQHDGAEWIRWQLLHNGGAALLADEMGIGKSAQAITALDAADPDGRVLVVCPAIVRQHWLAQIARWGSPWADAGRWEIESYEGFQKRVRKDAASLDGIRNLVLDEIHYLANPASQRSKAIDEWLFGMSSRCLPVRRLGLTGTPITSRPADLWHVLHILWPGRFGAISPARRRVPWGYAKRYCNGHYEEIEGVPDRPPVWVFDGASNALELKGRLADCMLRRTKGEVAQELPSRTRVIHEVALPAKARKDLARAQSAINWKGQAKFGVQSLLSNVEAYKIAAAVELTREIVAGSGRVLLVTTRIPTAHELADKLRAPQVDGETPADQRRAVIAEAPVAVATIKSITTGIDLTGFDNVIFVGLDWVPATLLQAEARVHRLGQDKAVTMWYLIGVGTVDEIVKDRVLAKLETFADVIGAGSDGLLEDMRGGTDDELLAGLVELIEGKAA
jgi:SWI/SNF-related matrix-associated actin-dependent regulator 1 of chromatin subfamily A